MGLSVIITLFVYLINYISCMLKKYSRFLVFLMLALLLILMGANKQNPDIIAYITSYNTQENMDVLEFGYAFISKLFYSLGANYDTFRMVFSFIGIMLIHQTVKKFTEMSPAVYLLYFIYPFMMDVVQMKNFMAMAIFIYAIPYLLSDNKKDIIKFIILILLASSMQITAIIYLPIFLIIKVKKNIFVKFIIFESVISIIVVSLNKPLLYNITQPLINLFSSYDERILMYAYIQTKYGFLLFWFMQMVNFILIYWANHIYEQKLVHTGKKNETKKNIGVDSLEKEKMKQKFLVVMLWINVYAFMFLPLYVFQSTFSRFMRNIVPLNLIALTITSQSITYSRFRKRIFTVVYIVYTCFLFYMDIYVLYSESIVEAIFKYNWIFN